MKHLNKRWNMQTMGLKRQSRKTQNNLQGEDNKNKERSFLEETLKAGTCFKHLNWLQ